MDPLLFVFVCVLGAVFGSFGAVLAGRLPEGESILGRSYCLSCKKPLGVLDLFPVLSFVCLRGRCRYCGVSIPADHLIAEVLTALLFVGAFLLQADFVSASLLALSLWLLLLLALSDAQSQTVPDTLTLPFMGLSLLFGIHAETLHYLPPLIVGGFFLAQWIVSRGKWVGSGDILIGIGIGFLLTSSLQAVSVLAASYILGALVASVLLVTGRKTRKDHLAFVPFLFIGTVVVLGGGFL